MIDETRRDDRRVYGGDLAAERWADTEELRTVYFDHNAIFQFERGKLASVRRIDPATRDEWEWRARIMRDVVPRIPLGSPGQKVESELGLPDLVIEYFPDHAKVNGYYGQLTRLPSDNLLVFFFLTRDVAVHMKSRTVTVVRPIETIEHSMYLRHSIPFERHGKHPPLVAAEADKK